MAGLAYRIVHVVRNEHSAAFQEVAELLFYSLADLGYDVDLGTKLSKSRRNIVVGANQIDEPIPQGIDYVVLQLEQLPGRWWAGQYPSIVHYAKEVWDYSPENLAFLKSLPVMDCGFLEEEARPRRLITLGYHEQLNRIPPAAKTIDVLFYGSMNDRRRKVLADCEALGLNVLHVFSVYGKDRDALIAQARVVLNCHFYEEQIFEQARVSYLLNNGVTVVSENSAYDPYWNVPFVRSPYELLATTCKAAIDKGCEGSMAREQFKAKHPMTAILKEALK